MGSWKYPVGVAYVLPNFEQGGTEKHVLDLAAGLDRRKFAPIAIATSAGGPLEETFRTRAVPVRILPFPGISIGPHPVRMGRSIRRAADYFSAFSRILREGRVAIVHSYLPVSNILGTAAGWIGRVPVRIVSKRGLCRYKKGHPVQTILEDLANLLSGAVLVNSSAVAEEVRRHERFLGRKIRCIYNGIAAASPTPEPIGSLVPELAGQDDGPVVACVANLFPYKGHRDLVAAARIVADGLPGVRFLLVGRDAGEEEKVRALIGSLGLHRHVFLTGPRNDVPRILSSVDLVVHPSHEEGFSNVVLEAMTAGKAVVATAVGGIPEAVVHGETGLLVPPHDPARLGEALLTLLRDPERSRPMGEEGRRRVLDHFPISNMVAKTEEVYRELLEGYPCR